MTMHVANPQSTNTANVPNPVRRQQRALRDPRPSGMYLLRVNQSCMRISQYILIVFVFVWNVMHVISGINIICASGCGSRHSDNHLH